MTEYFILHIDADPSIEILVGSVVQYRGSNQCYRVRKVKQLVNPKYKTLSLEAIDSHKTVDFLF